MVMRHDLYVALFSLMAAWKLEDEEREDTLECCREAIRTVLSVTGVHRATEVLAECWILLTELKVTDLTSVVQVNPSTIPISSAVPSPLCCPLSQLGKLRHSDMLEEELSSAVHWVGLMLAYKRDENLQADEWLRDLEFMLDTSRFVLMHRSA